MLFYPNIENAQEVILGKLRFPKTTTKTLSTLRAFLTLNINLVKE